MNRRLAIALSLFVSAAAFAQPVDLTLNVSGTAANPGGASPWIRHGSDGWALFHGFVAHVTHANEVGPDEARSATFSTNWLGLGAARDFGRFVILARGRVSLEPYTIQDDTYPQTLQYVSAEGGGPLVDQMRPHDLFGEAAVQIGFRPTDNTMLHVYGALVGDPALGPPPAELRASGMEFPEAPLSYDIAETWHDSVNVMTAGFTTRWFKVEGSLFQDAVTTGDHTELPDGGSDATSARLTLTPSPNVALQVSRGTLGEDANERRITSASLSYGTQSAAMTAQWTRRERDDTPAETAYGIELALRSSRNTLMGRAEWVDRPEGFPDVIDATTFEQTTHYSVGYIFDVLAAQSYRVGAGVNIDYHTQSHDLPERYGHKPQTVYAFVRIRT